MEIVNINNNIFYNVYNDAHNMSAPEKGTGLSIVCKL